MRTNQLLIILLLSICMKTNAQIGILSGTTLHFNDTLFVGNENLTNNGTLSSTSGILAAGGSSTWDGAGDFELFQLNIMAAGDLNLSNSTPLTLNGNFVNNGDFSFPNGSVVLDGSSNQSISGASPTSFYNLTNTNSATTLTLEQNITVTNTLAMSGAANIDMNANNINLSTTGSITGESNTDRIYDTDGTAEVSGYITATRTLNAPSAENVAGLGAVITSATNLGSTIIKRGNKQQTIEGNNSILRYYSIAPTTNTGLNATVVFNYFENELNGQAATEGGLVMWRTADGGTTWTNEGGTIDAALNTITVTGINAFSRWAPSSSTPLPVSLISFDAKKINNKIELKWSTASEINNEYFIIERSLDGVNFDFLTKIQGQGNTNTIKHYTTFDNNPYQGLIYYRLTQVDKDSKSEKLKTVSIINGNNAPDNLWANSSPNSNSSTLFIQALTNELVTIKMFDLSGKLIQQKQENIVTGVNTFTYKNLNEGLYLIQVESDYNRFSPLKTLVQ